MEVAKCFACGGYDVIVDGIIGPWFLESWLNISQNGYEVHYIILRASKEETRNRGVKRDKLDRKTNIELVETMWEQFNSLENYESYVIDTTSCSIDETVLMVREKIERKSHILTGTFGERRKDR